MFLGLVMLGVIPCHGWKGNAAAGKDTRRHVGVVLETYSRECHCELYVWVKQRHVFIGKILCLQLEDKDLAIVTGKWATNAQRNQGVFSQVFQRVSGQVFGTDPIHSRGPPLLVRSPSWSVRFPGSIVFDLFGLFGFAYSVSP